MTSTETQTATFFDEYASEFDAIYGTRNTAVNQFINRHFRQSMRLRYEKTLEGCRPIEGRSVLDIGCGPGLYAVTLAARGADLVFGVDFAEGMLDIARRRAAEAGVGDQCRFEYGDFLTYEFDRTYDYSIVMGFMDYMEDPATVIKKVVDLTDRRAFFSFPVDGGMLAWQRKLRYKRRCPLYLYTPERVRDLFDEATDAQVDIATIERDLFVTVEKPAA